MYLQSVLSQLKQVKYSGITKILRRNLYQDTKALDTFYSSTKESGRIIGSIPKDIIALMPKDKNKNTAAHQFIETMGIIGQDLQIFEGKKLEAANKINIKNFIGTFLPKLAKVDIQPERIPRIFAEMRKKLAPDKNAVKEFNALISGQIEYLLKQNHIIASDNKVRITYLGQGVFKNAFKFEILNKNGEHLMHPKVLLSFKKPQAVDNQNRKILELLKKYMTGMKRGEFIQKIESVINSTPEKVIPKNQRDLYKEALTRMYDDINSGGNLDKLKDIINKDSQYKANYNGILPEGNIIMFLKHAAGKPLKKTNFIDIPYIDPKFNIGIAEYSDDLLPKISKEVDLKKLGIVHTDLVKNKDNMVNDRVIDYGCIKILKDRKSEILANDSIARRYYNKLKQIKFKDEDKTQSARIEYWNNLYDLAMNHKIPNHNNVLTALEVSKEHISPKNLTLLHDFKPAQ